MRLILAMILTSFAIPAFAAPTSLAVQGRLTGQAGGPVADGNYALQVALYAAEGDKAPVFLEKFIAVAVTGGLFSLDLGLSDKPLDDGLFIGGQAKFFGVQVGGDPELPRVALRPVPSALQATHANLADALQCSGCVTGAMLASGTVEGKHVAFTYAGSASKGGPADLALVANLAKAAEVATTADSAKDLACTGCVGAAEVDANFAKDLQAAGQLAKVALSGAYGDLTGGPDLSPFAQLGKANTFTQPQTLQADTDFSKHQALFMRLQNSDKEPTTCDASTVGLIYYDTSTGALRVCNGKEFASFAYAIPLGSDAKAPGTICQQLLDKGIKTSGVYWLDPNGGNNADAFQAYCDMTTDGGGWTKVESAAYKFFFSDANWQAYNTDKPKDPNYSILGQRTGFASSGTYTYRMTSGTSGDWQSGPIAHVTVWQQGHDAFTATTNGSDYKYLSGDQSSTCGGFSGLHNKYTGYSYTCDPDSNDSNGCWWMQVVPKQDYDGKGYLEGYGGSGHYHQWQALWLR